MKTSIQLDANGVAVLECPAGNELRVDSVYAKLTNMVEGDQLAIDFRAGTEKQASSVSEQLAVSISEVFAFRGAGTVAARENQVDPVTGIVTYQQPPQGQMSLPEMWWEISVRITVLTFGGDAATGTVWYEVRPLARARALSRKTVRQ